MEYIVSFAATYLHVAVLCAIFSTCLLMFGAFQKDIQLRFDQLHERHGVVSFALATFLFSCALGMIWPLVILKGLYSLYRKWVSIPKMKKETLKKAKQELSAEDLEELKRLFNKNH